MCVFVRGDTGLWMNTDNYSGGAANVGHSVPVCMCKHTEIEVERIQHYNLVNKNLSLLLF